MRPTTIILCQAHGQIPTVAELPLLSSSIHNMKAQSAHQNFSPRMIFFQPQLHNTPAQLTTKNKRFSFTTSLYNHPKTTSAQWIINVRALPRQFPSPHIPYSYCTKTKLQRKKP
jgi:hypothetical protein